VGTLRSVWYERPVRPASTLVNIYQMLLNKYLKNGMKRENGEDYVTIMDQIDVKAC